MSRTPAIDSANRARLPTRAAGASSIDSHALRAGSAIFIAAVVCSCAPNDGTTPEGSGDGVGGEMLGAYSGGTFVGNGGSQAPSTGGNSGLGGIGTSGASGNGGEGGFLASGGAPMNPTRGTGGTGAGGSSGSGAAGTSGAGGNGASGGGGTGGGGAGGMSNCEGKIGSDSDGDANIDLAVEHQTVRGFGGINVPGWIADLTPAQTDTAFGNGDGQLGMSILRVRVPYNSSDFAREVPTAQRAVSHGAIVFASPWTPPPNMKTNNNIIGGQLSTASYGAYADHLISFRDHMESNGVPLFAISIQNEPDIQVEYESCDWNSSQFISWLTGQGEKFGSTKIIAAESFNFNRSLTDAILSNSAAEAQVDIVGGHIYGNGLYDYPLARTKGKEVWMTEHYTDSQNSANAWPLALGVGKEIHDCMAANFNAYVWWYIRRSYGPITEDGNVSKRGYLMAQYSKFVRPGFVRIGASQPSASNVHVTAYKNDEQVVVVAVNTGSSAQNITLDLYGTCVEGFSKITTSGSKNLSDDGTVPVTDYKAAVSLDAQSVTTFVSQ